MENQQFPSSSSSLLWTRCIVTALVVLAASIGLSEARKRSPTVQPASTEVHVGGLAGHTVHFVCDLPLSDPPNIQWFDEVYNDGEEPQLIYSSIIENDAGDGEEDGQMNVNPSHSNRHNFRIGADYSLTISHLDMEQGPGRYFCRSTMDDGTINELNYLLTVLGLPVCNGTTTRMSGEHMFLDCHLEYSGPTKPNVEWYRTVSEEHRHHRRGNARHDDMISSVDESDITDTAVMARKIVKNRAHPVDDGSTYRCKVSIGQLKKECDLKLSIQYAVQDLKITPEAGEVFVGDVIKCSALGNPKPSIELEPEADSDGRGWRSFVVSGDYADKELSVQCSASNTLNGTTTRLSESQTYRISERPGIYVPMEEEEPEKKAEMVPEATTTRGHHQHDHVAHHSHPPETEKAVVAGAQPVQKQSTGTASLTSSAVIMTVLSALIATLALN